MRFVNIGSGYLKLESKEATQYVMELVDSGEFWEYISVIFEKSLKDKETNVNEMMELLLKLNGEVSSLKDKLDEQPKIIQTVVNPTEQSSSQPPQSQTNTVETKTKEDIIKAKPVKAKKRPTGGGLIGARKKTGRSS